ncbi:MAG: helix-turn-helix domain-containing protein [Leadbetterella sp.]
MTQKNIEQEILLKVRKIRNQKGYSQENMASSLGIEQSAYQKIESGKSSLKLYQLFVILDLLGSDFKNFLVETIKGKKDTQCPETVISELELNLANLKKVVLKE